MNEIGPQESFVRVSVANVVKISESTFIHPSVIGRCCTSTRTRAKTLTYSEHCRRDHPYLPETLAGGAANKGGPTYVGTAVVLSCPQQQGEESRASIWAGGKSAVQQN